MYLLDYCENYIERVNFNPNFKANQFIYDLCFLYCGGYNTTKTETKKLKTFFNI